MTSQGVYGSVEVSEDSADRIPAMTKFLLMHNESLPATSWILQIMKVLNFCLLSDCKCIITIG